MCAQPMAHRQNSAKNGYEEAQHRFINRKHYDDIFVLRVVLCTVLSPEPDRWQRCCSKERPGPQLLGTLE